MRSCSSLKNRFFYSLVLAFALLYSPTAYATKSLDSAEIFEQAAPSVALIITDKAIGSGSYIGNNYILTNWHVVADSPIAGVFFKPPSGNLDLSVDDVVIGVVKTHDLRRDLALLRVSEVPFNVTPLRFGLQSEIKIGMDVHAIGHPTGEIWTYTKGVISQIRKNFSWRKGRSANVIQTQTPINSGNSGGPLLNDKGEIIGINTFSSTIAENLNFAIALDELIDFVDSAKVLKSDALVTTAKARSINELYLELGFLLEMLMPTANAPSSSLYWGFSDAIKQISWLENTAPTSKYAINRHGVVLFKANGKEFYRVTDKQERVGGEIRAMGDHSGISVIQLYPSKRALGAKNSGATIDLISALAVNPDVTMQYLGSFFDAEVDGVDQFFSLSAQGKKTILLQASSFVEENQGFHDALTLYYKIPPNLQSLTTHKNHFLSKIPVRSRTVEIANLYAIPTMRPISFAHPRPSAGEKHVIAGRLMQRIPLGQELEGITIQVAEDSQNTLPIKPGAFINILFRLDDSLSANSGNHIIKMLNANDKTTVRFFVDVVDNSRLLWLLRNDEYLLYMKNSFKIGSQ